MDTAELFLLGRLAVSVGQGGWCWYDRNPQSGLKSSSVARTVRDPFFNVEGLRSTPRHRGRHGQTRRPWHLLVTGQKKKTKRRNGCPTVNDDDGQERTPRDTGAPMENLGVVTSTLSFTEKHVRDRWKEHFRRPSTPETPVQRRRKSRKNDTRTTSPHRHATMWPSAGSFP